MHDPHLNERVVLSGEPLDSAKAAMIMVHGRGATAESILSLAEYFDTSEMVFAAPQAAGNTWYPYSFLNAVESNEPGISSGIKKLHSLIELIKSKDIPSEKIFLLGFSQGACLTLEYCARNPSKFGGIFGLSGGIIGPDDLPRNYSGSLESTPVFLGCSDVDPHVPVERVNLTEKIFNALNASVTKRIYPGMPHTVNEDEIKFINDLLRVTSA